MASLWHRFPTEWRSALNSALVRDFDWPIVQRYPRIVHGSLLIGLLSRWPFQAQAAVIAQTIHLGPRWDVVKAHSHREAFLDLAHETVHVVQQARFATWMPRSVAFWLAWLPSYLALAARGCVKAWAHGRAYEPGYDHPWERQAQYFEDNLRANMDIGAQPF